MGALLCSLSYQPAPQADLLPGGLEWFSSLYKMYFSTNPKCDGLDLGYVKTWCRGTVLEVDGISLWGHSS